MNNFVVLNFTKINSGNFIVLSLTKNLFNLTQPCVNTFILCHRVCTGTKSYTRVVAHRYAHACNALCTTTWAWSLRGPFSPCRDRVRCRPRDFRNVELLPNYREGYMWLRRFASTNTKDDRRQQRKALNQK